MGVVNPAPNQLNLESPALGPWFDDTGITLQAPAADLSVAVTPTTDLIAFAPATGLLSYAVASDPRPALLGRLRAADGGPAFTSGNLIALFRLSPGVEQRLGALSQGIVPATGAPTTTGVPTRPTVRHLAYEFTADAATITLLEDVAAPPIGDTAPNANTAAEKAAHLGLGVADDGATLVNGPHPMTDLVVAGQWFGERAPLVNIGNRAFTLWAFDDNGHAIDPGAVASWWNHLATTLLTNLWAPGPNSMNRTVAFAAQLTVHLVNPAEGPLDADLLAAVNTTGLTGSGAVLAAGTNGAALSFTDPPGPNDAPLAMAMLPNGTYGQTVTLYPTGAVHTDLTRDYIRLGVLDVERQLVGQPREAPTGASDDAVRRAADQRRATTRVMVNRVATANLTLHTSLDAAAGQMLAGLGANPSTVVLPTLDREYASFVPPTLPAVAPPATAPVITARALIGGGDTEPGSRIDDQVVLLQLAFDGLGGQGAWIRVWPHGFDAETGRHVALDGGAGVVLADDTANVIVTLPVGVAPNADGDQRAGLADAGCDISVITANGNVEFADVRFERPMPVGGAPIDVPDAAQLVACETGPVAATAALRPGSTLFSIEGVNSFALVDRASVALAGFAGSIDAAVTADETVCLTAPAFVDIDAGDVRATGDLAAGTVQRDGRTGLSAPLDPGLPHPTMERHDAASSNGAATAAVTATIGPAAGLRRHHELPPHLLGHPGAPAAREAAGVGVSVNGSAALAVAEFTRDRASPATADLATAARPAPPTINPPNAPTPWVAVLRTIGFGVDGEPGLPEAIRTVDSLFPGFDDIQNVLSWLETAVNALPGSFDPTGDVPRALSRRMLACAWGLREVTTSVAAAVGRAEDLVYIETPAIDTLTIGADGDTISPMQALVDRVAAQPALHVVVCLPRRSPPGWPAKLGRVRDALAQRTLAALEAEGPGRIGVFHPAAGRDRALDLASTALVVDDTYALAGTSHLWRRGLSFDGGLAAAVFDENLTMGRPTAVRAFRLALIAQRLGATAANVPLDPEELVASIRDLAPAAGAGRATTGPITTPDPVPTATDIDLWNRDGSAIDGFNPFTWLLETGAQSEFVDVVP